MDAETASLELKGLSKTIQLFHNTIVKDSKYSPSPEPLVLDIWIKFFQLHLLVANNKTKHDPQFRPWSSYLSNKLEALHLQHSQLVYTNQSMLQDVLQTSQQFVKNIALYYKKLIENQLTFLNTNSISFSQEYLAESIDYYSFWHSKFDKMIFRTDQTDIDVILLANSLKLFNQNHDELQASILDWDLPLGCHYPKFDDSLATFLASLPPLPSPRYSSSYEIRNLPLTSQTVVEEEYTKAIEFLNRFTKNLEVRCRTIFPMPDLLDRRFKCYREKLEQSVEQALVPLKNTCESFIKARSVPQGLLAYLAVNESINAVNSCGKILVVVKRRVREALAEFLVRYYLDVLTKLKKSKKVVRKLQKRRMGDLSSQLKFHNWCRAYGVWKVAINKAVKDVGAGKLVVISNVFQAQFYFVDFLNERD